MDLTSVATVIALALGSLIPAAITYLRGSNRRARHQVRLLEVERDQRDDMLFKYRAMVKLHNMHHHPDGDGAIDPPKLPPHLAHEYLQGMIDDVDGK